MDASVFLEWQTNSARDWKHKCEGNAEPKAPMNRWRDNDCRLSDDADVEETKGCRRDTLRNRDQAFDECVVRR
jgi:hypothetical protein